MAELCKRYAVSPSFFCPMLNLKIFYVGHAKSPAGKFYNWDVNSDGLIDKEEVHPSSNFKKPSETPSERVWSFSVFY